MAGKRIHNVGASSMNRPESDGIMARVIEQPPWPARRVVRCTTARRMRMSTVSWWRPATRLISIVDIRAELNSDQYLWTPEVVIEAAPEAEARGQGVGRGG
jgi:hypothetical protein